MIAGENNEGIVRQSRKINGIQEATEPAVHHGAFPGVVRHIEIRKPGRRIPWFVGIEGIDIEEETVTLVVVDERVDCRLEGLPVNMSVRCGMVGKEPTR